MPIPDIAPDLRNAVVLLLIWTIVSPPTGLAQENPVTHPPVTARMAAFRKEVRKNPDKQMLELRSLIPDIRFDLRYATNNNFVHRPLYPTQTRHCFLRRKAALALQRVQNDLQPMGLGIKVFDAYRPYSVTVLFWNLVKDERYVANPARGSGHNRGVAVDLTIIHHGSGEELNMGTGFDNFSDTAHHAFPTLPDQIGKNRLLLKTVMEKHGFRALETEWWHYTYPDSTTTYEILDIPFEKLRKGL